MTQIFYFKNLDPSPRLRSALKRKGRTLRSGAQVRRDPLAAIQAASDALLRQVDRVKHRLRPATH